MAKAKVKWEKVALNEEKLTIGENKFILSSKRAGVFGIGQTANLLQLNGVEKKHIKVIGWLKSDNHSMSSETVLEGIVSWEQCKIAAVKYIEDLLK